MKNWTSNKIKHKQQLWSIDSELWASWPSWPWLVTSRRSICLVLLPKPIVKNQRCPRLAKWDILTLPTLFFFSDHNINLFVCLLEWTEYICESIGFGRIGFAIRIQQVLNINEFRLWFINNIIIIKTTFV